MDWYDLHKELAWVLRDPRTSTGDLITGGEDGVRYPKAYRDKLLNAALRLVLNAFDPVYIMQNGSPGGVIQMDEVDTYITPVYNGAIFGTTKNIERVLSISCRMTDGTPIKNIPIIARTNSKMFKVNHPHWKTEPFAMVINRTEILIENAGTIIDNENWSTLEITYVVDFPDYSSDVDLKISKSLMNYVIAKAFVLETKYSRKTDDYMQLTKDFDESVQGAKVNIEQTKQLTKIKR